LVAFFDLASLDLAEFLFLSFVLLAFADLALAALALAWVCWLLEGPFENGAAVAGWLRARTLATANGQILVGRIRVTNGLFLVWRESPVATQIAIALKKLKKAKKRQTG
jgi:hypothetical protein